MCDKKGRDDLNHPPKVISITLEDCCDSEVEYKDCDYTSGGEFENDSELLCDECKRNTELSNEKYHGKRKKEVRITSNQNSDCKTENLMNKPNSRNKSKTIENLRQKCQEKLDAFLNDKKRYAKREYHSVQSRDSCGVDKQREYTFSECGTQELKGYDSNARKSRPESTSSKKIQKRSKTVEDTKQKYTEKKKVNARRRPHSQSCDSNKRVAELCLRKDLEKRRGESYKSSGKSGNDCDGQRRKCRKESDSLERKDNQREENQKRVLDTLKQKCIEKIKHESCQCTKKKEDRKNYQINKSEMKEFDPRKRYIQCQDQIARGSVDSGLNCSMHTNSTQTQPNSRCDQSLDKNNWSLCMKCKKRKDPQKKKEKVKEENKVGMNRYDFSKKPPEDCSKSKPIDENSASKISDFFKNIINCQTTQENSIIAKNSCGSEEKVHMKQPRDRQNCQSPLSRENLECTRKKKTILEHYESKCNSDCEANCKKVKELCDRLKDVKKKFEESNKMGGNTSPNTDYLSNCHQTSFQSHYKDKNSCRKKFKNLVSQGCQTEFVCKCIQNSRIPKHHQITQTLSDDPIKRLTGIKNTKSRLGTEDDQRLEHSKSRRKHKKTRCDSSIPRGRRGYSFEKMSPKQKKPASSKDDPKRSKVEYHGKAKTEVKKGHFPSNEDDYEGSTQERVLYVCDNRNGSICNLKKQSSERGDWESERASRTFDREFEKIEKNLRVELNSNKAMIGKKERASDKWRARIESYCHGNF